MITRKRLETILAALPRLNVALVGDLFLDRYLEIEPGIHEHSIETGLEAYQVTCVRNSPGALGTVMNNLAALSVGKLTPITVIGDDGHGDDLRRSLKWLPIDDRYILSDPQRLTPTYTKPLAPQADGSRRELNRFDVRSREPLSEQTCQLFCRNLQEAFVAADGLIVLDQIVESNWGVIDDRLRVVLDRLANEYPQKLICIDSRAHLDRFRCGILKGNRTELCAAAGLSQQEPSATQRAAVELTNRTGKTVYCTQGEEGMLVTRPHAEPLHVPGYATGGPVDIVGAGDSASAGIVSTLLAGGDEIEAAEVGNLVASITVEQMGTTGTATAEQVRSRWQEYNLQK